MPTQRPFFANFLTIFRAHSLPKAQPSISTSGVAAAGAASVQAQTIWTSTAVSTQKQQTSQSQSQPSEPLPINAKANTYGSSLAPALQHNVSPQTHLPRSSPAAQGLPVCGPPNKPQPNYPTAAESRSRRARRGSDSSASSGGGGGFREARNGGGETWFVGGRTAAGEERFYKLSMVKRDRSSDRISADQLSL